MEAGSKKYSLWATRHARSMTPRPAPIPVGGADARRAYSTQSVEMGRPNTRGLKYAIHQEGHGASLYTPHVVRLKSCPSTT